MDITVRRTGAERSWSLEDLLGRPMGTIAETRPVTSQFTRRATQRKRCMASVQAHMRPWTPLWRKSKRHARCLPDGRGSRSVAEIDPGGSAWGPQAQKLEVPTQLSY
jgi:hypothetical protein